MKYKNLFILHSQHYGFWWLGNARIQFISSHGIELGILEYSECSPRRVDDKCWYLYPLIHLCNKDHCKHICDSGSHQSGWLGDTHCIYTPGFVKRIPYMGRTQIWVWLDDANANMTVNSSTPGQNGRLFTDSVFICIFVNDKLCILVKISLNFFPKGPIDDNPALVQIMAWCWIGDKPLSEPMQTWFTEAYMWH